MPLNPVAIIPSVHVVETVNKWQAREAVTAMENTQINVFIYRKIAIVSSGKGKRVSKVKIKAVGIKIRSIQAVIFVNTETAPKDIKYAAIIIKVI